MDENKEKAHRFNNAKERSWQMSVASTKSKITNSENDINICTDFTSLSQLSVVGNDIQKLTNKKKSKLHTSVLNLVSRSEIGSTSELPPNIESMTNTNTKSSCPIKARIVDHQSKTGQTFVLNKSDMLRLKIVNPNQLNSVSSSLATSTCPAEPLNSLNAASLSTQSLQRIKKNTIKVTNLSQPIANVSCDNNAKTIQNMISKSKLSIGVASTATTSVFASNSKTITNENKDLQSSSIGLTSSPKSAQIVLSDSEKKKIVSRSTMSSKSSLNVKQMPEVNAKHKSSTLPKNVKSQLEQQYNKMVANYGVGQISKEVNDALVEFRKWQIETDPYNKISKEELNTKLNELIKKHQSYASKRRISVQKVVNRSLPTNNTYAKVTSLLSNKRKNSVAELSDRENDSSKKAKTPTSSSNSCGSTESLLELSSDLNDAKEKDSIKRKEAEHNSLYHLLRSDATDFLQKQKFSTGSNLSSSSSVPSNVNNSSGGHSNIQILNGQLSDLKGPIKLLEKTPLASATLAHVISNPHRLTVNESSNANFLNAGLTAKSKAKQLLNSKKFQENLHKIFPKQNNNPSSSVNLIADKLKNSPRRTASGRSKSLNLNSNRALKSRFKINAAHLKTNRISKNIDREWNNLTDLLASTLESTIKPISKSDSSIKQETNQNTKHANVEKNKNDYADLLKTANEKKIDQFILWNAKNRLGNLSNMSVLVQRNEFGMIEVADNISGSSKCKKINKTDEQELSENYMICGHSGFKDCFNTIINRVESTQSIPANDKKPHEYYSNELKDLIQEMLQKNDNQCSLIKIKDIVEAMNNSDAFEVNKESQTFKWHKFVNENVDNKNLGGEIILASLKLFVNSFHNSYNLFSIGDKLEAIDPMNCTLFCVCTVVNKCGFRIKIHFDGYHSSYDFWINADSENIFPVGWCNKTGRELQWPHRRLTNTREAPFSWKNYLKSTNGTPAPRSCFNHLNAAVTNKNPFKIGMKLEADDIKFSRKICVATIGDVIDSRILITFDGFDDSSNYWADITSPYIHPVNWHNENGYSITMPQGWKQSTFKWDNYLRVNRAEGVPENAFCPRNPIAFTVGMALEVVDKKNPSLLRPATIVMVDDYEIKILFIGWPEVYAYWVDDDSPDIHPPNWANKTGHPIEHPLDKKNPPNLNGCGIIGCRGIGNAKKLEVGTHKTLSECPYEIRNWQLDVRNLRPNRIERKNRTASINNSFNIGAPACRTRISHNPVIQNTHVSLQTLFNPTELATMRPKDIEMYRRLQVSTKFLLDNIENLSKLRNQWLEKLQPLKFIQLSAATKNPLNWSIDEVSNFVSQLPNCSMLGTIFVEHEIDGMAFLSLRQNDMINKMGLSLGSAIKVFNRIIYLREDCNTHYIKYV